MIGAISIKSKVGLLRQLTTMAEIAVPNIDIKNLYKAIWDAGASASVITQFVVDNLGLVPTGMSLIHTANGTARQHTYIIDIYISEKIIFKDVTVTCATAFSGGSDVLIGMDIISKGDFSTTNLDGKNCMSFRIPSNHEIDFCQNPDF